MDDIGLAFVLIVWLLLVLLILVLLLRHSNKKTMRKIAELRKKIESIEETAGENREKLNARQEMLKRVQALEKELQKSMK